MTALLECRNVDVHYGAFHALKDVSVSIPSGQRVAVFGHNGSGKSTLLKACVGVHKTLTGSVTFDGKAVVPGDVPRNSQLGIAFVPQSRNTFSELSVERNLRIAGLKEKNEDLAPVWEIFPLLLQRRDQIAGTMSGGEQQMLAFGMALMTRPSLLLLDEPTTGLSPVMANLVLDTVDRITTSFSIALMVVEQNVPRTLRIVDRTLIMKSGRMLSDTPASALVGRQDLWEWF
jgi:branched-chain amino acid transport system ATP-binding protein